MPKHRQEVLPRGPDNGAISLDSGMMGCSLPGWLEMGTVFLGCLGGGSMCILQCSGDRTQPYQMFTQ